MRLFRSGTILLHVEGNVGEKEADREDDLGDDHGRQRRLAFRRGRGRLGVILDVHLLDPGVLAGTDAGLEVAEEGRPVRTVEDDEFEFLALGGELDGLLAGFFDGRATGGQFALTGGHFGDLLLVPAFGGGQGEPDAERGGGGEGRGGEETRLARVERLLGGDVARDQVDADRLRQGQAGRFANHFGDLILSALELLRVDAGARRDDGGRIEDLNRET